LCFITGEKRIQASEGYRHQPSGNFEDNQRGHRKKRDKKVVGKNFTGDEGLGSGLEQELMPDYPHHLHFH
jgi:hypothetical protein